MKNILGKLATLALGIMMVASLHAEIVLLNFYADGVCVIENYEATSGVEYNLASILSSQGVSIPNCRGYNFIGWVQDAPVAPGVDPTSLLKTSITPNKNINFYAAYQKAGGVSNRFTRITSVRDLHAGGRYLLVCYYDHDGEIYYGPSYFAMKNEESNSMDTELYPTGDKYSYYEYPVYAHRYSILAEQIFPDGGVYDNPLNSIIWTLGGTEDAWTFTCGAQSLKICDGYSNAWYYTGSHLYNYTAYNHHILANPGNEFAISATNGSFNFRRGNYYLTYSDDAKDYFKMGSSNSWSFYLYKEEDLYTSYPDCGNWTVHLDAVDGTIGNTGQATANLTETGSGVTLPDVTKPAGDCDWTFAGWTPEAPIKGTTRRPKLYQKESNFKPTYDGETLYAVYTTTKYTKHTTSLTDGDYYVIVAQNGANYYAMGNVEHRYENHDYRVAPTPVTINSTEIQGDFPSLEWKYNSSYKSFSNVENSVYINLTNGGGDKHVLGASAQTLSTRYNSGKWAIYNGKHNLRWQDNEFSYYNSNSYYQDFDIYKKVPGSYTSYPHCTEYKVYLHGCGGEIGGIEGNFDGEDTELSPGGGITLPASVIPVCDKSGAEWTFVGWQEGGDVELAEDVRYTGLQTGEYIPSYDEAHLYAVFKRKTNKFDIIYNSVNIEDDDDYVITGYDATYDYAILTDKYDANHLAGLRTPSPQGSVYYVIVDNTKAIWHMDGTYNSCTFQNLADPTKYLASDNDGHTYTDDAPGTAYKFSYSSSSSGFSFVMQEAATDRYMRFHLDGDTSYFDTYSYLTEYDYSMYIYRRIKDYSSWPHCQAFTVNFDKGSGTVAGNITSMEEGEAYAGVNLPNAFANADCSKEGWAFAGWATAPVTAESDELSVDLLPAGTHYRIPSDGKTLYAVYYQRENSYKRLTSFDDLKTGVNYIITKDISSTAGKALGNTYASGTTDFIAAVDVTISGDFITNTSAAIDWRLSRNRYDEFEWLNVSDSVYLDLRTPNKAQLTSKIVEDNFEIAYSSGFIIRSIQSLEHHIKYLGYDASNNRFKAANPVADSVLLHIYRQEALYHSNPSCKLEADAVEWTREGGETYVYLESFKLGEEPTMPGGVGYPVRQDDGTFKFKFRIDHCSTTLVRWDGQRTSIRIPYIFDKATTAASDSLIGDCSVCDAVVMSGKTLNIDSDITLHALTLQEGATLNIADGATLTVNSLILGAKGDQNAPKVNLLGSNSKIILGHKELYYDLRIPEDRFYWISLPYDASLAEISYSNEEANGGIPKHLTNFYMYLYNGKLRGEDANGGEQDDTYWQLVSTAGPYRLRAGQGYLFGLADSEVGEFNEQGYSHTKRVMRFTMRPPESTWLDEERLTGYKITSVAPTRATNPRNAVHMGWNLIGNPYLHTYETGATSGLMNGEWEKEKIGEYETNYWIMKEGTDEIPYITVYDPANNIYKQKLFSNYHSLHPFEAVFVQINEGTGLKFENGAMSVPASAPAYMRQQEKEVPVRTGIKLSGAGLSDETGFVLADDYTPAYEIGADLQKMYAGPMNLYSLNVDNQQLAFNGLSEEDAENPIPVGVTFPVGGEFTFEFDAEQYSSNVLESLILIDKKEGMRVNLKNATYTFTTNAGTVNDRFAVIIRLAKDIITDIESVGYEEGEPRKIIQDGHLYILHENEMYNATGARVR